MTAPADALARLDDGLDLLPADTAVLEVFDRHLQHGQPAACLICGCDGQGVECDSCYASHDQMIERSGDL